MIRLNRLDARECSMLNTAVGIGLWLGVFASALVFIWIGNKWGHVPGLLHRLSTRSLPLLGVEAVLGWVFFAGWVFKPGKGTS